MAMESNVVSMDELLASCKAASQNVYDQAGEAFEDLVDGICTFAIRKVNFGTFNDKNGVTHGRVTLLGNTIAPKAAFDDASGKPKTYRWTLWGNSYGDQATLKRLASYVQGGTVPGKYDESVKAIHDGAIGVVVTVTTAVTARGFTEHKLTDILGREQSS